MWWVDTTHNDKMCLLLCFGVVFISLPQRNGVEESGVGHEMMQGTWLLPGSWQGAKTPCVVDIANMKVFSCGIQLYKCRDWGLLGQRGTGNWPSTCWVAEFKAWTSQSEKAARGVARDPSVDKEHGWEGDWQHLVGEGRFSRSLIYSRCSKVTYVWGFFLLFSPQYLQQSRPIVICILVQLPAGRNPLEAEADFLFFQLSLHKCAEGVTEQQRPSFPFCGVFFPHDLPFLSFFFPFFSFFAIAQVPVGRRILPCCVTQHLRERANTTQVWTGLVSLRGIKICSVC